MLEIFKIIRGYGSSAICATQNLNDFFALEDGKYGKGIINNNNVTVEIKCSQMEKELITTDRHELQELLNRAEGQETG